jgi:hypothetical protein
MQSTQLLPEGYREAGTVDLKKDRRLLILFNIAAIILLVVAGLLFLIITARLRPGAVTEPMLALDLEIRSLTGMIVFAAWVLGLTAFYVVVHEAVHGVFFWLFTRSKPVFAIKWNYAYAAAPGWYIHRNPFLVTTLAPLVFITLVGLVFIAVGPAGWLLPVWFIITMNAAGAVGDLLVAGWLLLKPTSGLVQDRGDAITLYLPARVD